MGWRDMFDREAAREGPWPKWAAGHGFEFQADGSELIGRYLPPVDEEEYYNLVRGRWRDLPFLAWARRTRGHLHGSHNSFSGGFVLQLPATPRADLLAMTPEQAFRAAGGELPRSGTFTWLPPDELLHIGAAYPPSHLEGVLENIAAQLAAAPAEIWQR